MEKLKRLTVGRIFVAAALITLFLFLGTVFYLASDYYKSLDAFSGDIVRRDQLAAREDLERLNYFYELNNMLEPYKLNWIADKYLFKDAPRYKAAYDYLTNRHVRVIEELKNDNSFWGHFIKANSVWRLAQGIYEQSLKMDEKTKSKMQQEADEKAYSTKDDYEEAIKINGGASLPPKWNYDFIANPSTRALGLKPKPGVIKVKLGTGGKKNKGMGKDKGLGPKGEGQQDLEIEGPPTEGKPKPGTHRPG